MASGKPTAKNAGILNRLSRDCAQEVIGQPIDSVQGDRVAQWILMLPPQHQQVIKMRYVEEMTFESIAKSTNRSVAQVRSTWFVGIDLLSTLMHDHDR